MWLPLPPRLGGDARRCRWYGLHSPRHDHLAGQSRVKTPPPRPLPRREVAVGMSYSLLWPPSEPTFSQTGSLGNVGGNRIPAMAHANRTTFGQAPECTTYVLLYNELTPPCGAYRVRGRRARYAVYLPIRRPLSARLCILALHFIY